MRERKLCVQTNRKYQENNGTPQKAAIMAIRRSDPRYPTALIVYLGDCAPDTIYARGNLAFLQQNMLGLFCSEKCPGTVILRTFDLVRQLKDTGVGVISGFHSPMEKECLSLLFRQRQQIIWCPAYRMAPKRILKIHAQLLYDNQLLILAPFGKRPQRATEASVNNRNEFVAALTKKIFVPYAAPGGMIERLCLKALEWNKSILTFDIPYNTDLLRRGALPYKGPDSIDDLFT